MHLLFIMGLLFILYFLCIAIFIGHGTNFYFLWLIAGVIFIVISICLKKELLIPYLPIWFKRLFGMGVSIVLLLFLLAEICILSGFTAKGPEGLDYIIVLGAQLKTTGPSKVLKMRLDKAYDYLERNNDTRVIVSGAQGSDEPMSEAQGMYDYLVEKGIDMNRIIMEDQSRNTSQNINFSSEFLDKEKDKVGIITNNFHVFRSVRIAKRCGYQNVYGIAAKSEFYLQPNNMMREFLAVMKDYLVGNI